MNLLIILLALFAGLGLVIWLLEGKAKPLSPEQSAKLSRAAMILVGIMLVLGALKTLL